MVLSISDRRKVICGRGQSELLGEKHFATRSLVTSEGWSLVRDRTNRKHCPSHKIWSYKRDMVVGEGGRSTGALLYCGSVD